MYQSDCPNISLEKDVPIKNMNNITLSFISLFLKVTPNLIIYETNSLIAELQIKLNVLILWVLRKLQIAYLQLQKIHTTFVY